MRLSASASFVLDTGVRVLTRNGEPVALSPKSFRLLEVLAGERPNAVSHGNFGPSYGPERSWEARRLRGSTVSETRAAIGDRDDDDPAIRTVHRFGYAFAAAVTDDAASATLSHCAIRWGSRASCPLALGDNVMGVRRMCSLRYPRRKSRAGTHASSFPTTGSSSKILPAATAPTSATGASTQRSNSRMAIASGSDPYNSSFAPHQTTG